MLLKIKKNLIVLFTMLTLVFTGCFEQPDEFVSPSWDVEVFVPLTKKEFSLKEIVEKDSSILRWSQEPSNLGLLYFSDTTEITTAKVGSQLKMSGFTAKFSQKIGTLNLSAPLPAAADIKVNSWAPGVTPGAEQVFPEQEGNVKLGFQSLKAIKMIKIEEGKLKIFIANKLPVEIVLKGVKIQNYIDESVIAEKPGVKPSQWVVIPPLTVDSLEFDVAGKTILDSLEYIGTIWTKGSNGIAVPVPEEAGTQILMLFSDLVVSAAKAPLPTQEINFTRSFKISDSTKIESVTIYEGAISLYIDNNMDVALSAVITFNNLFDLDNKPYTLELMFNRKDREALWIPLNGWKIATETPGTPTGELTYTVSIVTDSTDEISTISKDDSIAFRLEFEDLRFESFTGLLKPTSIHLDDNHLKLDYGDFLSSFKFDEINFGEANFYLNLNTSAKIKMLINTDVTASNGNVSNQLAIRDLYLPTTESTKIDVSSLVNGFSNDLPNDFAISGSAKLNPNYEIGTITRYDSVYGDVVFEIPLNVGISGGMIKDTLTIDVAGLDKEQIDNVNYAEVTFDIANSIPLGVMFTATIVDSSFNEILFLPPAYNEIDTLKIPAPTVSENGDIIQQGKLTQTIRLIGSDVQKFLENPKMTIEIKFDTPRNNNEPVKFKTSNKISFSVKGQASYKAEL